jgi:hypothetical protein
MSNNTPESRKERIHYLLKQGISADKVVSIAREIDSYIYGDNTTKKEQPKQVEFDQRDWIDEQINPTTTIVVPPTISRKNTFWSEMDKREAESLLDSGHSVHNVAIMMGRTVKSIVNQLSRGFLDIKNPELRKRFKVYSK